MVVPDHGPVLLTALLAASAVLVWRALPAEPGRRLAALSPRPPAGFRLRPALWVGTACVAALVLNGPLLALLCAAAGVGMLRQRRSQLLRRAAQHEGRRAVEACAALSAELTAGRSPAEALTVGAAMSSGPFAAGLAVAAAAERLGGDVPGAFREAAATSAVPALLRGLAACWEVCAVTGAGLARAVEQVALAARADNDRLGEIEAELAGPRATAVLLAGLPVGGMLMAFGLGADPLHLLLQTPLGAVCTVLGLSLELLGLAWTARIVQRAREA